MRRGLLPILLLSALPAFAQNSDVAAWYTTARVEKTSAPDGEIRFDQGHGWGASLNWFSGDNVSTELSYAKTKSDGRVDLPEGGSFDVGSLDLKTISLIVQWHFARRGFVDPYLGGGAARMTAGSLRSADLAAGGVDAVHIDSKTTWCANGGVNFRVTPRVAVAVDAKYIPYKPDSSAAGDVEAVKLKLNPLLVAAGVRLRF